MSEKHKRVYRALNYFQHFLVLFLLSVSVSVSAFTSLVGVPIGSAIFVVGIKTFSITTEIKSYKSIKKREKEGTAW